MATKKPKTNPPLKKRVRKSAAKPKDQLKKAEPITRSKLRARKVAEVFVASGGNASQAARAAGTKAKRVDQAGHQLLKNDEIQAEVRKVAEEARTAAVLTARQVLEGLSEIALFDPTPYLKDDGSIDLKKVKEDKVGHLFQRFRAKAFGVYTVHEADVYSRHKAFDALAACLGLKQAPKANEYDNVRGAVRAYMEKTGVDLPAALKALAKHAIVQKYQSQLLSEGVI